MALPLVNRCRWHIQKPEKIKTKSKLHNVSFLLSLIDSTFLSGRKELSLYRFRHESFTGPLIDVVSGWCCVFFDERALEKEEIQLDLLSHFLPFVDADRWRSIVFTDAKSFFMLKAKSKFDRKLGTREFISSSTTEQILPLSTESTAFNHRAIAWIQNSIAEEISLHSIALRCVQGFLGLANLSQYVLRRLRRSVQCGIRPNRSPNDGEWCNCRGFIYLRWVWPSSASLIIRPDSPQILS